LRLALRLLNAGTLIMEFNQQDDKTERAENTLEFKAILLVDDDKQLAYALQWILADENFLVDVAHDGEEAMLKIKAHEYDVVVCDLVMPRLRGDEFYLKAKQIRANLADHFIFITGFATDPKIAPFLTANNVKYLVKPFPVQGLISCVKELLRS
jgi:DNA-binding response OmpR family regulator